MADDAKQPVAIRIARPYASEEAYLECEIDTLTRTSVVLVGAQSRPQGVVLRFEVTLSTGAPLLRGEGRVVGFKANAFGEEPGLLLRFTRLDPRSKALIDRAAAIRDARTRPSALPPAPPPLPPPPPSVPEAPPPPSRPSTPVRASQPPRPAASRPPPLPPRRPSRVPTAWKEETPSKPPPPVVAKGPDLAPASAPIPPSTTADLNAPGSDPQIPVVFFPVEPPAPKRRSTPPPPAMTASHEASLRSGARTVVPPANRGALLDKLRTRARDLGPERVQSILASRRG